MIYEYKSMNNAQNSITKGVCFARDKDELTKIISASEGSSLISCKVKRTLFKHNKNSTTEKFTIPFLRSMGTLVGNNVNAIQALNITLHYFSDDEYKAIIQYLIYRISSGSSMSESVRDMNNPNFFDEVSIKSIEIAEKTATLGQAFEDISKYFETNLETNKLIKGSMYYPSILLLVILSVTSFWIFCIVPTFVESFVDMGLGVPPVTSAILSLRDFCKSNAVTLVIAVILIIGLIIYKRKSIVSKIPIVKNVIRNMKILKFFHSMSLMLNERINFMDALLSSSNVTNDKDFREKIQEIVVNIKQGETIGQSFSASGIFTRQELVIISSGESTSNMAKTFKISADMLQNDVRQTINRATSLLQPLVTLLMGGILLIVVFSVFMPIYDQISVCVQGL
jgi:type IV pilus assembly protein PilC